MEETRTAPGPERRVIIRTLRLEKWYMQGQIRVDALKGVNIEIMAGEFISVMGPSGSSSPRSPRSTRRPGPPGSPRWKP